MVPKGKLLMIGGAEDRDGNDRLETRLKNRQFERFEILKNLLPRGNSNGRIEVITAATRYPDDVSRIYHKTFLEIGYQNLGFIHISDRIDSQKKTLCDRVRKAESIFFTGGDQLRASTLMAGTMLEQAIKDRYMHDAHFMVAGTSAGAMLLSKIMITGGRNEEALLGTELQTASGLGFLDHCIIDTHFIKRGRFGRLAHAVIINPGNLGIGLGEDASLMVSKGNEALCMGPGMVVVIDSSEMRRSNVGEAATGVPIYVENLRVSIFVDGCKFML